MATYQYTGDLPTTFIHLQKDGHTWQPNKGDTIELNEPIDHPLLILISGQSDKDDQWVDFGSPATNADDEPATETPAPAETDTESVITDDNER